VAEKTSAGKSGSDPGRQSQTRRAEAEPASDLAQSILELQGTAGNGAVRRALGGIVQRKLAVGASDAPQEREADQVADRLVRGATPGPVVQRACACEDDDRTLRGKDAGPPRESGPALETRVNALRGGGAPLDAGLRRFYEPRFGRSFEGVRVHTGGSAAAAADAASARAFTVGSDIVFAGGQWSPHTPAGRHLLAHELTHVVQQEPLVVRRKEVAAAAESPAEPATADAAVRAPDAAAAPPAEPGENEPAAPTRASAEPLVDDEAETAEPGQMRKAEFFARLKPAVCAAAEQGFAGTAHEARHCPLIELYLGFYERRDVARINRDLPRFAGEGPRPRSAEGYIALITRRVREGVSRWASTGEITGVPRDVPLPGMELPALPGLGGLSALGGLAGLGGGGMLFKARPGGAQGGDPVAARRELGDGSPLDAGIRSRMETAFGTGLGHVRVHADGRAGRLASRFNAHAFTVGEHVAFGDNTYRPGTLVGDALIAHELAHVAQQGEGGAHGHGGLEHEADVAAVAAVAGLRGVRGRLRSFGKNVSRPRIGTALKLQRCSGCSACGHESATAAPARTFEDAELQAYLGVLDAGRAEEGAESHAKAREVITRWRRGDSLFILPVRRKVQLARELTRGTPTTDVDQDSILALLRGATDFEFGQIVAGVGRDALLAKFTDPRREVLNSLLTERSEAASRATREEGLPGEVVAGAQPQFTRNALLPPEDTPGAAETRENCIVIVQSMAPQLFRENPDLAARVTGPLRGLRAPRMTAAMELLARLGAATGPTNIRFTPGNGNSEPTGIEGGSAFDQVLALVGSRQGWHVFGMAMFNGFHSVTLFVDNRPDGAKVYWADQWAIGTTPTGEPENFQQSPGSVSGFRRYEQAGFDGFLLSMTAEWWRKVFEGRHRRHDGTFVPAGTRWEATAKIWEFQFGGVPAARP
jgi:hypothetical protein